jgi:hypothetical protein
MHIDKQTGELNGWFLGTNAAGKAGIFPSNFVEVADVDDA